MSFVVLFAMAAALAHLIGRPWTIAIAPAIGFFIAGAVIGVGAQLIDTPLPLAIAVATVASALGVFARRQQARGYTAT